MKRWESVLGLGVPKSGGGARQKAIVALARTLAVDLWRIATGRVAASDLGMRMRPAPASTARTPEPSPANQVTK